MREYNVSEKEKKTIDDYIIANDVNADEKKLKELTQTNDKFILKTLANNPSSPAEVLSAIIAKSKDSGIQLCVIANPNCTAEILENICYQTKEDSVYLAIARNPKCTFDLLLKIYNYFQSAWRPYEGENGKKVGIIGRIFISRIRLSKNENDELLELLLKNEPFFHHGRCITENNELNEEILNNPNCPLEAFEILSDNKHSYIRYEVACQEKCPIYLLIKLLNDNSRNVCNRALRTLSIVARTTKNENNEIESLLATREDKIIISVLQNPNCPEEILKKFFNNDNKNINSVAKKAYDTRKMYSKFKNIADNKPAVNNDYALREIKEKQELEEKKLQEAKDLILEHLNKIKETVAYIENTEIDKAFEIRKKILVNIPEKELIIERKGRREINPKYLPYLEFINCSIISSNNLKVSGIDFRKTNISIDPQKVYKKDLSGCKFSDNNIVFKNLAGCNLQNCDISEERDSFGIEDAIIDYDTKLPFSKKQIRKRNSKFISHV